MASDSESFTREETAVYANYMHARDDLQQRERQSCGLMSLRRQPNLC